LAIFFVLDTREREGERERERERDDELMDVLGGVGGGVLDSCCNSVRGMLN
jgi:hypothetical protein